MSKKSESTERLVEILGSGKKNAVKRSELLSVYGGSDRQMRMAICKARLEGVCINNDQDGSGYYIPDRLDELEAQYRQTEARGKKILAQLKAIRHEIDTIRGKDQLKLSDIEAALEGNDV